MDINPQNQQHNADGNPHPASLLRFELRLFKLNLDFPVLFQLLSDSAHGLRQFGLAAAAVAPLRPHSVVLYLELLQPEAGFLELAFLALPRLFGVDFVPQTDCLLVCQRFGAGVMSGAGLIGCVPIEH
jgi:hypothetical protein